MTKDKNEEHKIFLSLNKPNSSNVRLVNYKLISITRYLQILDFEISMKKMFYVQKKDNMKNVNVFDIF